MTTVEKTSLSALMIAALALPTMILAKPLPANAQQQTTPTLPPAASPQTKVTQPRPNPDASGIYHVGDGVTPPKLIYLVTPEFSEKSRKRKVAGATSLSFIVEIDEHVRDVRVLKSCADAFTNKKDREAAVTLDQEAIKAASQYRFEPAQYQGKPVPAEFSAEINFQVF
jgi:hypothetical protein